MYLKPDGTIDIEKLRESELHHQVGIKALAVYKSQQSGVSLETALENLGGPDEPVGDAWLCVAQVIIATGNRIDEGLYDSVQRAATEKIQ